MSQSQTIKDFVNLFLSSNYYRPVQAVLDRDTAEVAKSMPGFQICLASRVMLAGPPDKAGYALWHPVESPIDTEMTEGFDRFLGIVLPPLFKDYLTYKCLLGMDLYEGTLPDIDPRKPLSWLEWSVLQSKLLFRQRQPSLIPFTYGPAGSSVLCFDNTEVDGRGDHAIVSVRYEDRESLDSARSTESTRHRVFDSFELYVDFLREWLLYNNTTKSEDFLRWLSCKGKPVPPELYYT